MKKVLLSALLASVAIPAFAADMPVKAPRPAEAIYDDWSGIYVGAAAGYAWGREKLTNDLSTFDTATSSSQLFGTSAARIFNGTAAIIQPPFSMSECLITNCNSTKMNGFIAGGFAGAQKQLGNWVIGIEGSWDFLGAKKSHSATEDSLELITRFQPSTLVTLPGQVIPAQTVSGANINLTAAGSSVLVTGVANQCIGTGPAGACVGGNISNIAPFAPGVPIPTGTIVFVGTPVLPGPAQGLTQAGAAAGTIAGTNIGQEIDHNPNSGGIGANGQISNGAVNQQGQIAVILTAPVTPNANSVVTVPIPGLTVPATGVTGSITIPSQVTLPSSVTIGLPAPTQVRALVTRSADLETKIDQIVDIRGKFGITNIFGPNVLLYGTGGGAIGHVNKSLSITQTTTLCTTQTGNCLTAGQPSRSDTFSAQSGDTRLGWVAGAGLDWKLGGFVFGFLYRHHEFPKGTVAFNEGTNSLGFGTSRVTVDSVQGRISYLFPIH